MAQTVTRQNKSYKLLKKEANFSNWEFKYKNPEQMHPQNRFEKTLESLARLIGDILSLYGSNP